MIEKLPTENQQRLLALVSLAASEADETSACPSEEEIAAFIDNELQGPARGAMLGHLSRCPDCYCHWLDVAEFLQTAEFEPEKQNRLIQSTTVWQRMESWFKPWKLAVPTAVAAALVILVVLWPLVPDISQRVDKQYASGILFSEALTRMAEGLPLPWEAAALGFTQSKPSLPSRAFGAGVWSGRARMMGEKKESLFGALSAPDNGLWSETQWADYYQFGRWAALLWALSSSEQTSVDWDEHRRIALALQARMTERPEIEQESMRAVRELKQIEQLVTAISSKEPGAYPRLSRRLVLMIQQLSPATL